MARELEVDYVRETFNASTVGQRGPLVHLLYLMGTDEGHGHFLGAVRFGGICQVTRKTQEALSAALGGHNVGDVPARVSYGAPRKNDALALRSQRLGSMAR